MASNISAYTSPLSKFESPSPYKKQIESNSKVEAQKPTEQSGGVNGDFKPQYSLNQISIKKIYTDFDHYRMLTSEESEQSES